MSSGAGLEATCKDIAQKYSACDVSDALLKLKVPNAGFLPDIIPIPRKGPSTRRLVAPISTILFVPKDHKAGMPFDEDIPKDTNIPGDKHWTDCPTPGSVAVLQQPAGQTCAVLGDILATRLKVRGVLGVVADGRVRDIVSIGDLSEGEGEGGEFQVWSRGYSTVGTGLQAKPWAWDVPLRIGGLVVNSGDIVCVDEGERGVVVIPRDKLDETVGLLPVLKRADDNVVADVQSGVEVSEAFRRHRN